LSLRLRLLVLLLQRLFLLLSKVGLSLCVADIIGGSTNWLSHFLYSAQYETKSV
jgi:hypothetical protein